MRKKSEELFRKAKELMPGGVNSPVRAFRAVGGTPVFLASGRGSHVKDVDGNDYLDFVCSWGPLILGHCHPEVMGALAAVLETGTSFGASTEREVVLTEEIRKAFPSVERVRLVNSGTEAILSAVRLARAATRRDKILKFEGCYHGHSDSLLVKAGSGVATLGLPDSPGVPRVLAELTLTIPFNDLEALEEAFKLHHGQLAAVLVEPVVGNMGVVLPKPGFLKRLRELTEEQGTVLIFDEVITGFRVAYGGAQEVFGIRADLTTLGKVIGGGLPVGAYGGKASLMEMVAPSGPVYQAGTLSGNPLAVAAGTKTLEVLRRPGTYERLEALGKRLGDGLHGQAERAGVPLTVNRMGSMLTGFFRPGQVTDYPSAKASDSARFAQFFEEMLNQGFYFPPSQFESLFVSTAHSEAEIDQAVGSAGEIFGKIGRRD
ncbi:MAG TPA: glutamate-1-semialdehyde 2,1-aminomutase [Terriglobia bacterium]|nr:glutamate-1-semialdehyde 2,1-aminomutase [Terriglobia bacterium]